MQMSFTSGTPKKDPYAKQTLSRDEADLMRDIKKLARKAMKFDPATIDYDRDYLIRIERGRWNGFQEKYLPKFQQLASRTASLIAHRGANTAPVVQHLGKRLEQETTRLDNINSLARVFKSVSDKWEMEKEMRQPAKKPRL